MFSVFIQPSSIVTWLSLSWTRRCSDPQWLANKCSRARSFFSRALWFEPHLVPRLKNPSNFFLVLKKRLLARNFLYRHQLTERHQVCAAAKVMTSSETTRKSTEPGNIFEILFWFFITVYNFISHTTCALYSAQFPPKFVCPPPRKSVSHNCYQKCMTMHSAGIQLVLCVYL